MSAAKVGCCGFPGGRAVYCARFPVVEVQQTFYKPPKVETALRWRAEAPPDFEFTVKAWQLVTHPATSPTYRRAGIAIPEEAAGRVGFFRPTDEVRQAWARTAEVARALDAKVVILQCPPSFTEGRGHTEDLRRFIEAHRGDGFLLAWEPRGSWREETVRGLCREMGVVHVVDPFVARPLWGTPRYLRLHGGQGYRHRYTDGELRWLAQASGREEGYILFNNLSMGEDAARFLHILARLDAEAGREARRG